MGSKKEIEAPHTPQRPPRSPRGEYEIEEPFPLNARQKQLLALTPPLAFLASSEQQDTDALVHALTMSGLSSVRVFDSIGVAVDAWSEVVPAAMVVKLAQLPPPPCDALKSLSRLTLQQRQEGIVVVVADNVRTHDGYSAFLHQVNCLICSSDLAQLPRHLLRARLYHLELYRHWLDAQADM